MCNSAADEANTLRDIVSDLTIICNEARQNAALTRPQGLKVPVAQMTHRGGKEMKGDFVRQMM